MATFATIHFPPRTRPQRERGRERAGEGQGVYLAQSLIAVNLKTNVRQFIFHFGAVQQLRGKLSPPPYLNRRAAATSAAKPSGSSN